MRDACGAAVEIDSRQQRRAGDARLRVGLHDARDRGRDVEIGGARLSTIAVSSRERKPRHQSSGGSAASRQRRIFGPRVIGLRNVEPGLGLVAGQHAAASEQHQA